MSKKLRWVVSGLLLALLAWRTDWVQVGKAFAQLRVELWLAAVALYAGTQWVSSVRWRMLARPLGFKRPLRQYTAFYFIGMYFNLVLPTSVGGDVVRAWYLDGGTGRRCSAFLSVVMDRLSGLVVLLLLALLASVLSPIALPGWVLASTVGAVGCAVVGLAILPLAAKFSFFRKKYADLSAEVYRSLRLVFSPSLLILSLLVQSANVVIVWLVGQAIAAPIPDSYYWIMVPMVSLLTMLPVSINGMGVREWGIMLFLAPLNSISEGTALSLAFLWFFVFTAASLCGGFIYLFGHFPRPEVRNNHGSLCYHSDQGRTGQSKAAA